MLLYEAIEGSFLRPAKWKMDRNNCINKGDVSTETNVPFDMIDNRGWVGDEWLKAFH